MLCMVSVFDKRCDLGWRIRTKRLSTFEDCEKWFLSLTNRTHNIYRVMYNENGINKTKIILCEV